MTTSDPFQGSEMTGKAVVALIFSVMGLAGWCPCIGPILGIAMGSGERSDVGRAAVVLGWIGLGLQILLVLAVGGAAVVVWMVEGL